uniref:Uncharacterized protein n=1 Tax=Neolamprologus brichardi TaxID=32507 RepID=A0A3Q4HV50_NEOBR
MLAPFAVLLVSLDTHLVFLLAFLYCSCSFLLENLTKNLSVWNVAYSAACCSKNIHLPVHNLIVESQLQCQPLFIKKQT